MPGTLQSAFPTFILDSLPMLLAIFIYYYPLFADDIIEPRKVEKWFLALINNKARIHTWAYFAVKYTKEYFVHLKQLCPL